MYNSKVFFFKFINISINIFSKMLHVLWLHILGKQPKQRSGNKSRSVGVLVLS